MGRYPPSTPRVPCKTRARHSFCKFRPFYQRRPIVINDYGSDQPWKLFWWRSMGLLGIGRPIRQNHRRWICAWTGDLSSQCRETCCFLRVHKRKTRMHWMGRLRCNWWSFLETVPGHPLSSTWKRVGPECYCSRCTPADWFAALPSLAPGDACTCKRWSRLGPMTPCEPCLSALYYHWPHAFPSFSAPVLYPFYFYYTIIIHQNNYQYKFKECYL